MLIILSIVQAGILVLVTVLLAWSYPGRPKPFVDQNGAPIPNAIAKKLYLPINGVEQGMFIKGKDVNNPVLLYLHGGMPDYFLTETYPTGLEDLFTGEKLDLWRGKAISGIASLWNERLATDLSVQVTAFRLPVYFFSGIYDYTCNYSLAQAYFAKIQAPVKGFYTFAHSAHSPIFEEPDRTRQILREDVLVGANQLADH